MDRAKNSTSAVPLLQEISAFKIAWELWLPSIPAYVQTIREHYRESIRLNPEVEKSPLPAAMQKLPTLIKAMICHRYKLIHDELSCWVHCERNHYFRYTEFDIATMVLFSKADDVVWNGNLTIDYEETVMKMIQNQDLEPMDKYDLIRNHFDRYRALEDYFS